MTIPTFALVYASSNFTANANTPINYNTQLLITPGLSYSAGTWTVLQPGYIFFKAYLVCTQTTTANIYLQIVLNNDIIEQDSFHGRNTSTYYSGNTISLFCFGGALLNPGDNFSAQPGSAMAVIGGIGNSYTTCVFVPQATGGAFSAVADTFFSTILFPNQTFTSSTIVNFVSGGSTFFLSQTGSTFKALVTGYYEIMGVITLTGFTSPSQGFVQIFVNGVAAHRTGFLDYLSASTAGVLTIPFTYKARLSASDTFYIQINNATGFSMTMAASSTWMSVLMTQQG